MLIQYQADLQTETQRMQVRLGCGPKTDVDPSQPYVSSSLDSVHFDVVFLDHLRSLSPLLPTVASQTWFLLLLTLLMICIAYQSKFCQQQPIFVQYVAFEVIIEGRCKSISGNSVLCLGEIEYPSCLLVHKCTVSFKTNNIELCTTSSNLQTCCYAEFSYTSCYSHTIRLIYK